MFFSFLSLADVVIWAVVLAHKQQPDCDDTYFSICRQADGKECFNICNQTDFRIFEIAKLGRKEPVFFTDFVA